MPSVACTIELRMYHICHQHESRQRPSSQQHRNLESSRPRARPRGACFQQPSFSMYLYVPLRHWGRRAISNHFMTFYARLFAELFIVRAWRWAVEPLNILSSHAWCPTDLVFRAFVRMELPLTVSSTVCVWQRLPTKILVFSRFQLPVRVCNTKQHICLPPARFETSKPSGTVSGVHHHSHYTSQPTLHTTETHPPNRDLAVQHFARSCNHVPAFLALHIHTLGVSSLLYTRSRFTRR